MAAGILIHLLVVLVVCGVVVYLLNALIPMDARFKLVINCVIGLGLFLYVLDLLGVWHWSSSVHR